MFSTSPVQFQHVPATTSQRVARQPLNDEQLRKVAPSIFAGAAHDSRSERYTYIPTIDVLRKLGAEGGYFPFAATQTRCRDKEKREHTKHMIRLRKFDDFNLQRGEEVNEIVMVNSHDGTSAYLLMPGVFRVLCENGLVSGKSLGEFRVQHKCDVVDNVIDGVFRVVEDFQLMDEQKDVMKSLNLSPAERLAFARSALALRYDTAIADAPITGDKLLQVHRHGDTGDDLWTTFNVVQENMLKGGVRGRTANNRRMTTRPVQGVDQNIKLNRALWTLAEEMAKIKG
jgi:hypothetical protein